MFEQDISKNSLMYLNILETSLVGRTFCLTPLIGSIIYLWVSRGWLNIFPEKFQVFSIITNSREYKSQVIEPVKCLLYMQFNSILVMGWAK